jgi:predicted nucleic acid-binding protein
VNLAEALDVLQRVPRIPRERLEEITSPLVGERTTFVPISEEIARDAADVRARRSHRVRAPISLSDCILLAATRRPTHSPLQTGH